MSNPSCTADNDGVPRLDLYDTPHGGIDRRRELRWLLMLFKFKPNITQLEQQVVICLEEWKDHSPERISRIRDGAASSGTSSLSCKRLH